jgi:ATP synthase subunit C
MESAVPSILAGLGIAFAVGMSASGSATATTAAARYFVSRSYHKNKEQMILATCPIVVAGVLAIYGMIIGVMIGQGMNDKAKEGSDSLTILDGGRFLAAGLSVGSACQSSGNVMYGYLTAYWFGDDESNLCRRDGTKEYTTTTAAATSSTNLCQNAIFSCSGLPLNSACDLSYRSSLWRRLDCTD